MPPSPHLGSSAAPSVALQSIPHTARKSPTHLAVLDNLCFEILRRERAVRSPEGLSSVGGRSGWRGAVGGY